MRKSVRGMLAAGVGAAAVLAAGAPAWAKCGHGGVPCPDPVRIEATIYDPSWRPIVIPGRDAWRMLYVTGVDLLRGGNTHDEPPPELGPAYQVIYRITSGGRTWTIYQELYPYAAGRPFAYTRGGQRFMDRYEEPVEGGYGWRGSRTLEWILQAHGLPEEPPATSDRAVRAAGSGAGGGGTPPWWLGGILALGALLVVPRLRRRSA